MNFCPISVFIIAKNEADRIPLAIASVIDWVDEVIVIDSGSEDETVSISESMGAKVVFNEWEGYGPQKVFGELLCNNDWLLRKEIERVFEKESTQLDAYRLPILPIYGFQTKGHPWNAFHKPVRLYKLSKCGFKSELVHDSVHVPNSVRVGTFKSVVNHRSFRSLVHHIEKVNFYSTAQAEVLYKKGRRTNIITMFILPFLAFWKSYLLRREFVNGIDGILTSHMYAFQRFIRYAKLRELEHKHRDDKH